MKFPRHARIFRGQLDATPFAGVLFCLLIFILLGSLIYTPGFPLQLPHAKTNLPGVAGPTIAVAMDANGQFYFQNQTITETNLWQRLARITTNQAETLTLIIQPDKFSTLEQLNHLQDLAASAGVKQIWQQVLPGPFDRPESSAHP